MKTFSDLKDPNGTGASLLSLRVYDSLCKHILTPLLHLARIIFIYSTQLPAVQVGEFKCHSVA